MLSKAQDTKLYTGDTSPSLFSRMDMVAWAMTEIKDNGNYVNFGSDDEPAFARTAVNPDKTGLNTTDNALQFSSLKGHSWWPDFANFDLIDPITITEENRYLHIYHYRENLNKGLSVNINKDTPWEDADKGTKRFDMNLKKPGVWEDVIVDLKWFIDNQEQLSRICILIDQNWGGDEEPATNYFFDEIVLNNSNLPRGINLYTEKEIEIDLGNQASMDKYVETMDMQNSENTNQIVANPFTDQNTNPPFGTVMMFNKSANASWWQGGPRIVLNGSLPVGGDGSSAYLHVFVNVAEADMDLDYYVVQLNAKDFKGNQIDSGDRNKFWTDDEGLWTDFVMDVTSLEYVSEFTVRFDVRRDAEDAYINSPAGVFYLDHFVINNSEDPRDIADVTSSVYNQSQSAVKVFTSNQRIVVEGNVSMVDVYGISGHKLGAFEANGLRTEIPMNRRGLYLVKSTTPTGAVETFKVVIK